MSTKLQVMAGFVHVLVITFYEHHKFIIAVGFLRKCHISKAFQTLPLRLSCIAWLQSDHVVAAGSCAVMCYPQQQLSWTDKHSDDKGFSHDRLVKNMVDNDVHSLAEMFAFQLRIEMVGVCVMSFSDHKRVTFVYFWFTAVLALPDTSFSGRLVWPMKIWFKWL